MESILISIRPEWCERILSGEKTIEVRKNRPKIDTPFRCYIYETKGEIERPRGDEDGYIYQEGRGAVIGEFVCDKIKRIDIPFPAYWPELDKSVLYGTCLSLTEIHDYLGHRSGYGWHISDLRIYDEPKPLKRFQIPTTYPARRIRQPPQSWCYAEEIT